LAVGRFFSGGRAPGEERFMPWPADGCYRAAVLYATTRCYLPNLIAVFVLPPITTVYYCTHLTATCAFAARAGLIACAVPFVLLFRAWDVFYQADRRAPPAAVLASQAVLPFSS